MTDSKNNKNPKVVTYDNVTVDDVIGLNEVKEYFKNTLIYYYVNKQRCEKLGIRQTKGIILSGPPGVGKTLVCAACVNSYGNKSVKVKFVDSSELTSNQKGEAEKKIIKVFSDIKEDTLVVIDEIDGLCPSRKKLSSVLAKEITSALIKALDRNRHITLVGTTNFVEDIDDAIMRRVDEIIEVPYPSLRDRIQMFDLCLKNIPIDDTVNIDELGRESDGFSGNDILSILKNKLGLVYLKKEDTDINARINQDEVLDILYAIRKENLPKVETVETKIYELLKNNGHDFLCRNDIAEKMQMKKQNISRALVSMTNKGLISFSKKGRYRFYSVVRD